MKAMARQMLGCAYTRLGRLAEAGPALRQALDYTRLTDEKETELYCALSAAAWLALSGDPAGAWRLLAAVDGFVAASGFPLVGGAGTHYEYARNLLKQQLQMADAQRSYGEGGRTSLPEAIAQALRDWPA
jgi:Flp pilus assembly protein TadD